MRLFALITTGKNVPAQILSNPNIAGVSLRLPWPTVEPLQGQYDFSYYTREGAKVKAAGKELSVRINHGGATCPPWFFAQNPPVYQTIDTGVYRDTYGDVVPLAIWWSPQYLAAAQALVKAFGAALGGMADIVPPALNNSFNVEWAIVSGESNDVAELLALGYTSNVLLDASMVLTQSYLGAFPNSFAPVAIGPVPKGLSTDTLKPVKDYWQRVLDQNLTRSGLMSCDLSAKAPSARWAIVGQTMGRGSFQMLWSSWGDTTYRNNGGVEDFPETILRNSLAAGLDYSPQFVEVYQADVINMPDVIQWGAAL